MASKNTQEQIYPDGTVRVTFATHTTPGVDGKHQEVLNHQVSQSATCDRFEAATKIVRNTTQVVVGAVASKISSLLHVTDGFLVTEGSDSKAPFSFNTFTDIVEGGEHLEHFHSYQKSSKSVDEPSTIEMHIDQGLMLVFTPGRLTSGELTSGFYIQTLQGTKEEVHFSDSDDLIVMLGDGVNQYINPKIQDSNAALRAVPHAVTLAASEHARIWYGLMVLPPAEAIHPIYSDVTFGKLRQDLVAGESNAIHLACSNNDAKMDNRLLQTCRNGTEFYCWHQCYILATYNVSESICAAQNRKLACIAPNNKIWSGVTHGTQYIPGCAGKDWPVETVNSPVKAPTKAPLPSPVKAPTKSPSKSPTKFPTIPPSTGPCGFLGLSIFCLGEGQCGFFRRLFNMC
jgi:hypothetical protein